ncbi:MAG TPA: hypothetical protein VHX11_07295 [Acidobacteriaceae bacterium]|jgi:5-methylcytosine-specific restriction protein B|nr:hypothetical protein [Acidobacteriaceae bacterium]
MTRSEEIRKHVLEQYITPAREKGLDWVTVRAGDVHRYFHWTGRMPSVCQALGSHKFERQAGVALVEKSGPPSGQSPTVKFTYRLLSGQGSDQDDAAVPSRAAEPSSRKNPPTLMDLFGIGKDAFRRAGGGEAFLKKERADWGPSPWERLEAEQEIARKKGRSH